MDRNMPVENIVFHNTLLQFLFLVNRVHCSIFDCIGRGERICKIKCRVECKIWGKMWGWGQKSEISPWFNMIMKEKNVGVLWVSVQELCDCPNHTPVTVLTLCDCPSDCLIFQFCN